MTGREIRECAATAVKRALLYMDANESNMVTVGLASPPQVLDGTVILWLDSALKHPEGIRIFIRETELPGDRYSVVAYYSKERRLDIACGAALFRGLTEKQVTLKSDLRFIIERYGAFFGNRKPNIALCETQTRMDLQLSDTLSSEQQTACAGALANPLSCVCGGPGTGKTTAVLTSCVLNCCRRGIPSLIVAPTNEALDKVLPDIIEAVRAAGSCDARECILRLGMPTPQFQAVYPLFCEGQHWYDHIKQIRKEIGHVAAQMEQTPEHGELEETYERLQEELRAAQPNDTSKRLSKALIVGATADTVVHRLACRDIAYQVAHIFLDEAAYTPLIKALPLLSFGAKLTMFGDPQQLAPICTMPKEYLEVNTETVLFAQSALWMGSLLETATIDEIAKSYLDWGEPRFRLLRRFELTQSFRYGRELANVLAKEIYGGQLTGEAKTGTAIEVIDVARTSVEASRVNTAEAKAVINYIAENALIDYAVLTPYNEQAKLIRRLLREGQRSGRVLTIHSSQSREWETVILSVSDSSNKYFTDSTNLNSHGLQVLNTAVSRARSRLVIVCDTAYWRRQEGQFLQKLIEEADRESMAG